MHFLRTQSVKLIHTADTGVDVANKAIFNFVLISYSPLFTYSFKINAFRQDLPKSKKKKIPDTESQVRGLRDLEKMGTRNKLSAEIKLR